MARASGTSGWDWTAVIYLLWPLVAKIWRWPIAVFPLFLAAILNSPVVL